jgi:Flp pilus assembly protein TadB
LTIRIPATQFDAALSEIRGTASRVVQEKVTGQDVTEEFIDLEAGLRTKKALEAQFLEILKQAKTVDDALSVQTQIAEVRGEIEKLEGRRKFLENQTSLSTVTISIRTPEVFAAGSTGFFSEVWRAVSDGVNAALAIILGLIRVALALLPLLILFGLPLYFLVRYLRRKTRREKLAAQFAEEKH